MLNKFELLARSIRQSAIEMTSSGGSSHIGSVLSMADLLSVLFGEWLDFDPQEPKKESRDRFILSKGHAGAGVYAALAHSGFFDVEMLKQHYQNGSLFSGHVSHKGVPGVEFSTGSLGHGLPVAAGMSFALKQGSQSRVVCLLGDGECDEGSNWEAALFAAHHGLSNLTAIVDYNKLQSIRSVNETLRLEPFREKWEAFGWFVCEIDGHNHDEILKALEADSGSKPKIILAHTIKGKGVSFMENSVLWHYRSPQGEEKASALEEVLGK
ncbi:MAG: transketolase [Cycloclasticus sp.]|jgi:Transketolase, N-terminal subunit